MPNDRKDAADTAKRVCEATGASTFAEALNVIDGLIDAEKANHKVMAALTFYADGEHFDRNEPSAWDTTSGEASNYWCDKAGTATVEDGWIAREALRSLAAPRWWCAPCAQEIAEKDVADGEHGGEAACCPHCGGFLRRTA